MENNPTIKNCLIDEKLKGSAYWLPRCNSNETPLTPYGRYVQKLEQENNQLKSDANTDKATISRINEKLDEANEDKRDMQQENAELKAQLAAKNEPLSNTEQLPIGTIVHIVIEFANKKGYRMLHISELNYTCKKAFEWAHNQAEIVEAIITSYNYILPPKNQY